MWHGCGLNMESSGKGKGDLNAKAQRTRRLRELRAIFPGVRRLDLPFLAEARLGLFEKPDIPKGGWPIPFRPQKGWVYRLASAGWIDGELRIVPRSRQIFPQILWEEMGQTGPGEGIDQPTSEDRPAHEIGQI
jgi:hypothetical protein